MQEPLLSLSCLNSSEQRSKHRIVNAFVIFGLELANAVLTSEATYSCFNVQFLNSVAIYVSDWRLIRFVRHLIFLYHIGTTERIEKYRYRRNIFIVNIFENFLQIFTIFPKYLATFIFIPEKVITDQQIDW